MLNSEEHFISSHLFGFPQIYFTSNLRLGAHLQPDFLLVIFSSHDDTHAQRHAMVRTIFWKNTFYVIYGRVLLFLQRIMSGCLLVEGLLE